MEKIEPGSELRLLLPIDKDSISNFAMERLATVVTDPMECKMQSWNARWRPEALDYYLSLGWSFGDFVHGQLMGFLLAQPFVFHRGMTQTLWVEEVQFVDLQSGQALLDCAYRWARDKHFQCVLADGIAVDYALLGVNRERARGIENGFIEIKSTRY